MNLSLSGRFRHFRYALRPERLIDELQIERFAVVSAAECGELFLVECPRRGKLLRGLADAAVEGRVGEVAVDGAGEEQFAAVVPDDRLVLAKQPKFLLSSHACTLRYHLPGLPVVFGRVCQLEPGEGITRVG